MPIDRQPGWRNLLRGLAIAAAMILAPALAQDAAQPARPWTDPPGRGSAAAPDATPEKPARQVETQAAAPRSSRRVVKARSPVRNASRPVRARIGERTMGERRIAARHAADRPRRVRAAASPRLRASRMVAFRPVPMEAYGAPSHGDRVVVIRPGPVFVDRFVDDRARRMRLAREAGYTLIRSRTDPLPDGVRGRGFRPDDVDE